MGVADTGITQTGSSGHDRGRLGLPARGLPVLQDRHEVTDGGDGQDGEVVTVTAVHTPALHRRPDACALPAVLGADGQTASIKAASISSG